MVQKRKFKESKGCSTSSQTEQNSELIESQEELKRHVEQLLDSRLNDVKKEIMEIMFPSSMPCEPLMYLNFTNEVNSPAFTNTKLEGKDGTHIKVALFDSNNAKIISGSLSSLKIEVVPLFDEFGDIKWTKKEFHEKIAQPRPNNGPLLKGKLCLELKDGEVSLLDIRFGDNSSGTRTRMYRLGVRAVNGGRIREAITDAFVVKDRHGKDNQKLHPPLLDGEIGCLEKVGKDRATKLQKGGIFKVRDFLRQFYIDEVRLLEILKIKATDESWKTMVDHARECSPEDNLLCSYPVMNLNAIFFFNSLYEFVGAKFGDIYTPSTEINPSQKASVLKWKNIFYQNMAGIQFDHQMVDHHPVPYGPTLNNMNYGQDALRECNPQTISPGMNLVASDQKQFQVLNIVPGSSNIPLLYSDVTHLNGDMSFGGSVSSHFGQRTIQQGEMFIQFGDDLSAVNTSSQHVSPLMGTNEEALAPFKNAPFDLDNWFDSGWPTTDFPLPIDSRDLDASVNFDHFLPAMPLSMTDQPLVHLDLPDQATDLSDEASKQRKWPKVIAVVKWKVMLSVVQQKKRKEMACV